MLILRLGQIEHGGKGRFGCQIAVYRGAAFELPDPATAAQQLLNIPKSRLYGAEAELTYRPSDAFTLHAGLGLLSTRIKNGIVSGVNVAGNRLSNAPSVTFNASFDWTVVEGGFGAFSTRARSARTGRNPRTGDQVDVAAKRVPYFKPGKEMRARLNTD